MKAGSRNDKKKPYTPRKWWKDMLLVLAIFAVAIIFYIYQATLIESAREVRVGVLEGVVFAGPFRRYVVDYYEQHQQFPQGTAEEIAEQLQIPPFKATANTQKIQVFEGGVVEIEYTNKVVPGGKKLLYIPSVNAKGKIEWRCENGRGAAAFADRLHIPAECRE